MIRHECTKFKKVFFYRHYIAGPILVSYRIVESGVRIKKKYSWTELKVQRETERGKKKVLKTKLF